MTEPESWRAVLLPSGEVELRREALCVYCCKRKRAGCSICEGRGVTGFRYPLTREQAAALASEIGEALALTGSPSPR